jgi:hypothetical protein
MNDTLATLPTTNEVGYLWEVILPTDVLSKRGDFRESVDITYYVYAATRQDAIQITKSWLPIWDTGEPKFLVNPDKPIVAQRYIPDVQLVRKEHRLRMEANRSDFADVDSAESYYTLPAFINEKRIHE